MILEKNFHFAMLWFSTIELFRGSQALLKELPILFKFDF